jgi:hypothetical protein
MGCGDLQNLPMSRASSSLPPDWNIRWTSWIGYISQGSMMSIFDRGGTPNGDGVVPQLPNQEIKHLNQIKD